MTDLDSPLDDDQLCSSEFPGDDTFVGQLCERERGHGGDHEHLAVIAGTRHTRRLTWASEVAPMTADQPDRPFRDEPTEVLQAALGLASTHAQQAARFRPPQQDDALPAVADLFRAELQHRGGAGAPGTAGPGVHALRLQPCRARTQGGLGRMPGLRMQRIPPRPRRALMHARPAIPHRPAGPAHQHGRPLQQPGGGRARFHHTTRSHTMTDQPAPALWQHLVQWQPATAAAIAQHIRALPDDWPLRVFGVGRPDAALALPPGATGEQFPDRAPEIAPYDEIAALDDCPACQEAEGNCRFHKGYASGHHEQSQVMRDAVKARPGIGLREFMLWRADVEEAEDQGQEPPVVPAPAAVQPAADRAAVLREAADIAEDVAESLRKHHEFERSTGALDVMTELRRLADEEQPDTEARRCVCGALIELQDEDLPSSWIHSPGSDTSCTDARPATEARPARGDQFEQWLKTQRDRYDRHGESSEFWHEFDAALDLYRLHADTGTPLGEHVCEGRVVGDCECFEQVAPADTGDDHSCAESGCSGEPAPAAPQPAPLRAELKPWQLLTGQLDEPLPQTERVIGGRRLGTTEPQPAAADTSEEAGA